MANTITNKQFASIVDKYGKDPQHTLMDLNNKGVFGDWQQSPGEKTIREKAMNKIENTNYIKKIRNDADRRLSKMDKNIEDWRAGKKGFGSMVLQEFGQSAGFVGDIIGETIISVGDTVIPTKIKEKAKEEAVDFLGTPLGQRGLQALQFGMEKWGQFKDSYPNAADNIESVINIAEVLPLVKGVEEGVGTISRGIKKGISKFSDLTKLRKGVNRAELGLGEMLTKQEIKDAEKIIQPILSKKQTQQIAKRGGTELKRGKLELKDSSKTLEAAEEVKDIVKGVNPTKDIDNVNSAISTEAENLSNMLKEERIIFDPNALRTKLDEIEVPIDLRSDKTLMNKFELAKETFMDIVEKNRVAGEFRGEGLLQSRKDFDILANKQIAGLFDEFRNDTPLGLAVKEIRNTTNTFLDDILPDGVMKKSLRKQMNMFTAIDGIVSKLPKIGESVTRIAKAIDWAKAHPFGITALAGIGGAGIYAGLGAPMIAALGIYGTAKLGKKVITSKVVKKSLIKSLSALDKALGKAKTAAKKETINEGINILNQALIGLETLDELRESNDTN